MNDHIKNLVVKYLRGELTEEENLELQQWVHSAEENRIAFENASDMDRLKAGLKAEIISEQNILQRLKTEISGEKRIVTSSPRRWYRYIAAAAIFCAITTGLYLWLFQKNENPHEVTNRTNNRFKNDVLPAGSKATLTLADGRTISLDSISKGLIAVQGGAKIINTAGELSYNVKTGSTDEVVLKNTVSTKGGGEYSLTLSDGTKVFLNAASTLTFPVSFTANERIVEMTGEAYFEVAKDSRKPFKVLRAGTDLEIKVLGTKYNVEAYDGEYARVTILEGSVKISQTEKNNSELLSPRDQALITETVIEKINNPDLEDAMAWKNGIFLLNGKRLPEILAQVCRWYNIEIKYQTENAIKFRGKISRKEPLSKLLMILELTNEVKFSIDGRIVTVLAGNISG